MKWTYIIIIFGAMLVFMWLINSRQKRQYKQQEEFIDSLKVGDKVVTHSGIFGKIKRIYNTTYGKICVLEVGVNNKFDIEMTLGAVAALDEKTAAPEPTKEEKQKTEEEKKIKNKTESDKSENANTEEK